jgi:hypothetical protein
LDQIGVARLKGRSGSRRPSPSLVVSVLALFVALSGVAVALQRDSVRSRHIVDGTIQNRDLTDNVISEDDTAPLARDGSTKIGQNAVDAQEIAQNAIGGSELAPGTVGAIGLETVRVVRGATTTIADSDMGDGNWTGGTATVDCHSAEQILSAYGEWTDATGSEDTAIAELVLNADSGHVIVRGIQNTGGSKDLRAVAVCLDEVDLPRWTLA